VPISSEIYANSSSSTCQGNRQLPSLEVEIKPPHIFRVFNWNCSLNCLSFNFPIEDKWVCSCLCSKYLYQLAHCSLFIRQEDEFFSQSALLEGETKICKCITHWLIVWSFGYQYFNIINCTTSGGSVALLGSIGTCPNSVRC
jgi:hypothetical protein